MHGCAAAPLRCGIVIAVATGYGGATGGAERWVGLLYCLSHHWLHIKLEDVVHLWTASVERYSISTQTTQRPLEFVTFAMFSSNCPFCESLLSVPLRKNRHHKITFHGIYTKNQSVHENIIYP